MDNMEQMEKFKLLIDEYGKLPKTAQQEKTDTLASIFNKVYGENFISDWLSYLLDPAKFGSCEPLNALLSLADEQPVGENESVIVEREHTFVNGRRIDFYISTDSMLIGIENKIGSGEGWNQLSDYSVSLDKLGENNEKRVKKIFLKPNANTSPGNDSFTTVIYEDLIYRFKEIRLDFIGNLRAAFLMQDFIIHMEENIMADNTTIEYAFGDEAKFINKNSATILKMVKRAEYEQTQLAQYIEKCLRTQFSEEIDSGEWGIFSKPRGNYFQLYCNSPNWYPEKMFYLHFEILRIWEDAQQEDYFSYLPQNYKVEFHIEGRQKNQLNELPKLEKIKFEIDKKYNNRPYKIDYTSTETVKLSINRIISTLFDVKNEFADEINRILKEHI
jgi:hypothetical protein